MYVLKVAGIRVSVNSDVAFLLKEAKKYPNAKIEVVPVDSEDSPELQAVGMATLSELTQVLPEESDDDFDFRDSKYQEIDV